MSENLNQAKQDIKNPLASWYRQPKIYVKLPSKGRFYPQGALDHSANEEYAVYAMTAKDELMFKTPDALLSGQSTVEVIKSCVPAVTDPWQMPSIDLDFLLIAVRIATYGEKMEVSCNCPHCNAENSYDMDLTAWLQVFNDFEYNDTIDINPLIVHIRPYSYKEITRMSIKALEQQKIFAIVNDSDMSDEEKLNKFGDSFVKITELTVDVIAECISSIETPNGTSSDRVQIKEFINNCSKDIFDKISDHVSKLKEKIELKASKVSCGDCNEEFSLPVTMDQANFFAVKSQK